MQTETVTLLPNQPRKYELVDGQTISIEVTGDKKTSVYFSSEQHFTVNGNPPFAKSKGVYGSSSTVYPNNAQTYAITSKKTVEILIQSKKKTEVRVTIA